MAIWAGGDEQIFNRHKPVLDAMGDQAAYIGPIGAGTIAKLVHNCTSAVMVWRSPRSLRWDQGREV
jgi:3-hydroxyisobutyrate dehydrogenase-like beta-hydroxyacid dehydrogenase